MKFVRRSRNATAIDELRNEIMLLVNTAGTAIPIQSAIFMKNVFLLPRTSDDTIEPSRSATLSERKVRAMSTQVKETRSSISRLSQRGMMMRRRMRRRAKNTPSTSTRDFFVCCCFFFLLLLFGGFTVVYKPTARPVK